MKSDNISKEELIRQINDGIECEREYKIFVDKGESPNTDSFLPAAMNCYKRLIKILTTVESIDDQIDEIVQAVEEVDRKQCYFGINLYSIMEYLDEYIGCNSSKYERRFLVDLMFPWYSPKYIQEEVRKLEAQMKNDKNENK